MAASTGPFNDTEDFLSNSSAVLVITSDEETLAEENAVFSDNNSFRSDRNLSQSSGQNSDQISGAKSADYDSSVESSSKFVESEKRLDESGSVSLKHKDNNEAVLKLVDLTHNSSPMLKALLKRNDELH